jgi:hypothetical protein
LRDKPKTKWSFRSIGLRINSTISTECDCRPIYSMFVCDFKRKLPIAVLNLPLRLATALR